MEGQMTQTYSCIAIDDDPLFLRSLTAFIREIHWLKLEGTFENPIKGATAIVTMKPDLVLLDMDMPHVDGQYLIDWIGPKLRSMSPSPRIIVVSSVVKPSEKLLSTVTGFIPKTELKDPGSLEVALRRLVS